MTRLALICFLSTVLLQLPPALAASSEVDFKGKLVAEPCLVAAGGDAENVVVDFGTISGKTFYSISGRRTWLKPFHILLHDCDLTLGTSVKITFLGAEDTEQPGLLAVTSTSGVSHVAVGLKTETGKDLNFNSPSDAYLLSSGNTELKFKAYIQASDDGVKNRSVGFGSFEAITTFRLEYS
ncbi:fimbrial protein [Enterobacter bugandensis]|uniref:fimbrial protein n=1 Tax=Enterobacter bugandensis TaxID=881260 RepID=UPI0022DEEF4E|nr:fimbrial protein [Enterobacter bugandensis]